MKRRALGCFFLLQSLAVVGQAQEPNLVFSFELGGGLPAETQYTVKVFADGKFLASSEGMPIMKGGKLTKREYSTNISMSQLAHIVASAQGADQFVNNPSAPWPDCRGAEMVVILGDDRRTKISRKSGCIAEQWNRQVQVAALLHEVTNFLPKSMRGWP